jgi:cellulose synthase/poly-beta-1,6-N-acetylglucosamine synthase-like glycosyltransferase
MTLLTILITAFREERTLPQALSAICSQEAAQGVQVLVICPDEATEEAARRALPSVEVIRDPGRGKPGAINIGLNAARGDLIILTDGDVYVSDESLSALLEPFRDPAVGAVSGRPLSLNDRGRMLGYWSHLLTDAGAHLERLERDQRGEFMVCSGYLYAIRRGLIEQIPEDALADDAVVSHLIGEGGHRVRYAPDALVYVHYPTTYRDWLRQKTRSAGGYIQPVIANSPLQMRGFQDEARRGSWRALRYARSPLEFLWTLLLFAARLHLWGLIFWRVRVRRESLIRLWQRVETTK